MARKAKRKSINTPLLKNNIYAISKAGSKRCSTKQLLKANAKETKASQDAIERGKKMAKIEAYAKEHGISITKAMVHFM